MKVTELAHWKYQRQELERAVPHVEAAAGAAAGVWNSVFGILLGTTLDTDIFAELLPVGQWLLEEAKYMVTLGELTCSRS